MASTLADYAALVLDDPAVSGEFRAVVGQLSTSDEFIARLDEFISVAHQRMPRSDDGRHWRMLYIDASILKVLARTSAPGLQADVVRECISMLDHAIIIAGAAVDDARRDYVVHEVIKQLQSALPRQRPPSSAVLVPKPAPVLDTLSTARNTVRALVALPSVVAPHKQWSCAPFVLRRYADDWPAMRQPHQWASLPYLFSVAGPGRTVPVEVGDDYRSDDWSQKLVSWEDFLSSLDSSAAPHCRHHTVYLAQHSLFAQFPRLREDLILPDIVYTSLDSLDFPAYVPPHDVILNAWLGPRGTISPAHTDPYFNCYVQVVGSKTVWLAPPNLAAAMYPYHAPLAGADITSTTSPPMNNTSQVNVFASARHEIEASQPAFPLFWDTVPDQALSVTLNPGDMLFFPPGWWHAMRSEDTSFSVSMWF